MSPVRNLAVREHRAAALLLIMALIITWLAYSPGISGALHFDDYPNLEGLAKIEDGESALRFIATGISGPLGRPIALATFVPQAYAWPDLPEAFLRVNILIHLINGALVSWFLYLLGLARGNSEKQAALAGVVSGALWMLMPILASSSLMSVQRMTTLSATFVLLGSVFYFYARRVSVQRPFLTLFLMTLAIGLGTTLGAFTKENGILLVAFLFAAEAILLDRPSQIRTPLWRTWFVVVLAIPTALILVYLLGRLSYPEAVILRRDFNGIERLLTQAEILWKYLYLAFLPNASSLSPFHENYPIQRSILNGTIFLAVAAWIAVISAAVWYRRKAPLFGFAVIWFILGHSLESTSIPLELYFEHRNYLPLIGPIFAIACLGLSLPSRWHRLLAIGGAAYFLMLSSVLFSVTSLWGSPRLAAEIWYTYNPSSTRAVQNLAGHLVRNLEYSDARKVLAEHADANPDALDVRFQALNLSCLLAPDTDHSDAILDLTKRLSSAKHLNAIDQSMGTLHDLIREDTCPSITDEALYQIGQGLLKNLEFNVPLTRHHIHLVLAQIGFHRRDFNLTVSHLRNALELYPNLVTLDVLVSVLDSAGLFELSRQLLDDAEDWAPRNPIRRIHWDQWMQRIETVRRENLDASLQMGSSS